MGRGCMAALSALAPHARAGDRSSVHHQEGPRLQTGLRGPQLAPRLEAMGIFGRASYACRVIHRSGGGAGMHRGLAWTFPWRAGPCQSASHGIGRPRGLFRGESGVRYAYPGCRVEAGKGWVLSIRSIGRENVFFQNLIEPSKHLLSAPKSPAAVFGRGRGSAGCRYTTEFQLNSAKICFLGQSKRT